MEQLEGTSVLLHCWSDVDNDDDDNNINNN